MSVGKRVQFGNTYAVRKQALADRWPLRCVRFDGQPTIFALSARKDGEQQNGMQSRRGSHWMPRVDPGARPDLRSLLGQQFGSLRRAIRNGRETTSSDCL